MGINGVMKRNLIAIIILALLVVNTVMTGIMMFTIIPANKKTMELVGDISSAIQLDLGIAGSGAVESATAGVAMTDIATYNLANELTIRLKNDDGDDASHYAVVGVTLSLNKNDETYASYGETMSQYEGIISDVVNKTVGKYSKNQLAELGTEEIQSEILESLQEKFNSQVISAVSFSSWIIQ